ncbi:MAG: hypothetical protein NT003_01070 [Candidatus Magasanikbacteria bacterium]|nr:hypothetical protein [Candidatus Magasanikbacteria bacterium]
MFGHKCAFSGAEVRSGSNVILPRVLALLFGIRQDKIKPYWLAAIAISDEMKSEVEALVRAKLPVDYQDPRVRVIAPMVEVFNTYYQLRPDKMRVATEDDVVCGIMLFNHFAGLAAITDADLRIRMLNYVENGKLEVGNLAEALKPKATSDDGKVVSINQPLKLTTASERALAQQRTILAETREKIAAGAYDTVGAGESGGAMTHLGAVAKMTAPDKVKRGGPVGGVGSKQAASRKASGGKK